MAYQFDIKRYIDIIHWKNHKEAMERESKVEDGKITLVHVFAMALLYVIAMLVYVSYLTSALDMYSTYANTSIEGVNATQVAAQMAELKETATLITSPLYIVIRFVVLVVMFYLAVYCYQFVAKTLGGQGKMESMAYLTALLGTAFFAAYLVAMVASMVPLLGVIAGLFLLVLIPWMIYLEYRVIMTVHPQLGMWKSLAVLLVGTIVFIAVVGLLDTALVFAMGKMAGV